MTATDFDVSPGGYWLITCCLSIYSLKLFQAAALAFVSSVSSGTSVHSSTLQSRHVTQRHLLSQASIYRFCRCHQPIRLYDLTNNYLQKPTVEPLCQTEEEQKLKAGLCFVKPLRTTWFNTASCWAACQPIAVHPWRCWTLSVRPPQEYREHEVNMAVCHTTAHPDNKKSNLYFSSSDSLLLEQTSSVDVSPTTRCPCPACCRLVWSFCCHIMKSWVRFSW